MSYAIEILEGDEVITEDLYTRPLKFTPAEFSETYYDKSTYSGMPINNFKWTKVLDVLGEVWLGKTVGEFNDPTSASVPLEFARGELPESHILS